MPATTSAVQTDAYLEAVKIRPSVNGVNDRITTSDERITDIVNAVIQTCPSAWNMQSTHILITLGKEHKHFWNTVTISANPFVLESQGEDAWKRNEDRFKSFQAANGTVCASYSPAPIFSCSCFFSELPHTHCMPQISLFEDHDSIEELSKEILQNTPLGTRRVR